jgi:hypothetical protein
MQSHAQRRRQQSVLRPRQTKNDVNTGALATPPTDKGAGAPPEAMQEATREAEAALESVRRCAERDLI